MEHGYGSISVFETSTTGSSRSPCGQRASCRRGPGSISSPFAGSPCVTRYRNGLRRLPPSPGHWDPVGVSAGSLRTTSFITPDAPGLAWSTTGASVTTNGRAYE